MIVLALDTVGAEVSASLWQEGKSISFKKAPSSARAASFLPVMVDSILQETGIKFEDIDQLIVNKGPGSFTGIRIGLAFAKGLSFGSNVKASAIDGFTLASQTLKVSEETNILIALDARRPDFYCQLRSKKNIHLPVILTVNEIKALFEKEPFFISGNAALLVKDQLQKEGIEAEVVQSILQDAEALSYCYLQSPELFSDLTPYYLRPPDIHVKSNVLPATSAT